MSDYNAQNGSSSFFINHQKNVIDGIIDGGQYGLLRSYADVNNKNIKMALGVNNAVLDKFYICLYTPLNSAYGFLFVQSYTEFSIYDPIKNFIIDLFRYETEFYNVRIEPFVPNRFVEEYQKDARIRMFTYSTKTALSSSLRDNETNQEQLFDVAISIKPTQVGYFLDADIVQQMKKIFSMLSFNKREIGTFSEQKIHLQDSKERKVHYDIAKEIQSIRPTIYLEDENITIDETTGQPDFEKIRKFTLSLLDEVEKEYNHKGRIDEL